MNGRQAYRAAYDKEKSKKTKGDKGELPQTSNRKPIDNIDEHLAKAIDSKDVIMKYASHFERLAKTNDVMGFIQDLSPSIASDLFLLAKGAESEKVKLDAIKDFLDRAGFGKVNKHAVARFDASDSKEAIISTILGSRKDLSKIGIEIVDEDHKDGSGEADEG